MASHRLPDEDRPRRAVPAWVTAPPESASAGLEARPAPAAPTPVPETVRPTASTSGPDAVTPAATIPAPASIPALVGDVVVPDFPPREDLLPPAPTSPAVHTVPFDRAAVAAAPVSPIDAVPVAAPAPAVPAVPVVGQPRFSVPGLEHVVVEGTEPEPSGPIGYRTPARFAHQRPAAVQARSFDAVIAAPAPTVPAVAPLPLPLPHEGAPAAPAFRSRHAGLAATVSVPHDGPTGTPADPSGAGDQPAKAPRERRTARLGRAARGGRSADAGSAALHAPGATGATPPAPAGHSHAAAPAPSTRAHAPATAPTAGASASAVGGPRLQEDSVDDGNPLVGVTPGAVLGAIAGVGTLGLAAWWFLAPATVHGVGLVLGVLAVALSIVILRNPAATWQRPIALLGAVLGGVGTLVLLWAVAAAVLPLVGVTLPDVTGSGTTPTLAP